MEIKPNTVYKQRYSVVRAMPGTPPGGLYLGRDMSLEQAVLIKFRQSTGPAVDQQFLQSAARLMEIQHPNLARVVDCFVEAGLQGLVMDYIPGDNLVTFIQQYGALTMPELEPWVHKLGDALAYLHAKKPAILHGDIRPANLILTPESELILINYGMPELGIETLPEDQAAYAPPEHEEKTHKPSAAADQYSLAATLYYLLTKQVPPSAYQRQVEGAGITPLHTLKTQIPSSLHPAVAKAMALRPQDRHAGISNFIQAFLSAGKASASRPVIQTAPAPLAAPAPLIPAAQAEVEAPPPPPPTPVFVPRIAEQQAKPITPKKRSPAVLISIISVVAVGAIIGGILLLTNLLRSGLAAATSDPSTWPTVTPKPVTPTVEIQPTSQPSTSFAEFPNGSVIAYVSNKGDGVTNQIWLLEISVDKTGNVQILTDTQLTEGVANKSQPTWAPAGLYLVFAAESLIEGQGDDLYVMDFSSEGFPISQLTSMLGDEYEPAFSPEGTFLAWANKGSLGPDQSVIYFSEDMSVLNVIQQNYGEYSPTFSPDGEIMAYVADDGNGNYVINIAYRSDMYLNAEYFDRQLRQGLVTQVEWAPDGEKIAYTRFDPETYAMYIHLTTWTSRGDDDQQLTFSGGDGSASFSPDSKWIIFTSLRDGTNELYLMAADGTGEEINLTNSSWAEFEPAWMPVYRPVVLEENFFICGEEDTQYETDGNYWCDYENTVIPQYKKVIVNWTVADINGEAIFKISTYSEDGSLIQEFIDDGGETDGEHYYYIASERFIPGSYYFDISYNDIHYGRYWFEIIPASGSGGGE